MKLPVFLFILISIGFFHETNETTTPEVSIYEENPSRTSSRVRNEMDGRVVIWALKGETVVLECRTFNNPKEARVYWKWSKGLGATSASTLNSGLQSNDPSKYKIGRGKQADSIRLEIQTIEMGYVVGGAGIYSCESSFSGRSDPIKAIRFIEVYEKPRIILYDSSYETDTAEGDKVNLRCNAEGTPKPEIYWRKISGTSRIISGYGTEAIGPAITFPKAKPSDRGLYICNAHNKLGSTKWEIKLNVNFKPRVSFVGSTTVYQKPGCQAELLCKIEGHPQPDTDAIEMTDDKGNTLKDKAQSSRIRVYTMPAADSTIYLSVNFRQVKEEDYGTYKCMGTNGFGTTSNTIVLRKSNDARKGRTGTIVCGNNSNVVVSSFVLVIVAVILSLLKL